MLARAHVPDRAWLLAVAGKPSRRQRVERHPLRPGRDQGLAHPRASEHPLQRSDMEVLARMRARHEGQLRRRKIEGLDPARFDQCDDAERLDAASKVDDALRIAEAANQPPLDVDLDDIAPVDALLDPVPDLADEDRRRLSGDPWQTGRRRVGRAPAASRG